MEYYTHDLSQGVLPNDDLDLQLVWLNATEQYGRSVNAEVLGEYWLSYITADISEYGTGKANMSFGIRPPLFGWYHNHNKDSCGAFIRSEIWACLAPGHPEIAVKYAREDAIVDHADEGLYGEILCAAIQSAAFVESDMYKLIQIGLSYIPEECAVAGAVRLAVACYEAGETWKQARKTILQAYPGSFGMYIGYQEQEVEDDVPTGSLGFDAPSNIGLMIMGWVYGEGDFSKSICIAAGCCEDGDCTAGTLGAIMGIIGGTESIDAKWILPIGDEIKTCCVCVTKQLLGGATIPSTVTELTNRVVKLMPTFMHGFFEYDEKEILVISANKYLEDTPMRRGPFEYVTMKEQLCVSSISVQGENTLLKMRVEYDKDINISEGEEKKFTIHVENKVREPLWLNLKWHVPEAWQVLPAKEMVVYQDQAHGGWAMNKVKASLIPSDITQGEYDVILEVTINGRISKLYLPITLIVR